MYDTYLYYCIIKNMEYGTMYIEKEISKQDIPKDANH